MTSDRGLCAFTHPDWGQCQQARPKGDKHCPFHAHWLYTAGTPDRTYHRKIVRGLLQPAASYLSETELSAMFGKYHGDGRRTDQYVNEDLEEV